MRRIAFGELEKWCARRGYAVEHAMPVLTKYQDCIDVHLPVPKAMHALTEFLDDLVHIDQHSSTFVIWIRSWNIWNERSEQIGLRHLSMLTSCVDSLEMTNQGHIYLLSSSEWQDAIALFSVPVLYSWDASLFFESGRALINLSHHDHLAVSYSQSDSSLTGTLAPWLRS